MAHSGLARGTVRAALATHGTSAGLCSSLTLCAPEWGTAAWLGPGSAPETEMGGGMGEGAPPPR